MISILKMRLLHWKKQLLTLLFWLLFPIIATIGVIYITSSVQEDSEIPVGVVMEEDSPLANELVDSINGTSFIRVEKMSEGEALHSLETHELDSVFFIREGYQEQIESGSRNRLLMSYQSDLSFAYTPVSEMIISHVQQDTGRSKAAHTVMDLSGSFDRENQWSWEEVVAKSKELEAEENLLQTAFSFQGAVPASSDENVVLFDTWGLWTVFSILAALLLFDWLIKERRNNLYPRFIFSRISFKLYLILNAFVYTLLFLVFDFIALLIFHLLLDETLSWHFLFALITYRFMLNAGVFAVTLLFRNVSIFYTVSFALTLLIAVISGAVLPIEGLTDRFPWLEYLNLFSSFLNGEMSLVWLLIFLLFICLWFVRKEKAYA
jgi:ABC-2 type transport system permease protein